MEKFLINSAHAIVGCFGLLWRVVVSGPDVLLKASKAPIEIATGFLVTTAGLVILCHWTILGFDPDLVTEITVSTSVEIALNVGFGFMALLVTARIFGRSWGDRAAYSMVALTYGSSAFIVPFFAVVQLSLWEISGQLVAAFPSFAPAAEFFETPRIIFSYGVILLVLGLWLKLGFNLLIAARKHYEIKTPWRFFATFIALQCLFSIPPIMLSVFVQAQFGSDLDQTRGGLDYFISNLEPARAEQ